MNRTRIAASLFMLTLAAGLLVACGSGGSSGGASPSQEYGPPLDFPLERSVVPSPGFCRVYNPRRPEASEYGQARGCDGIEQSAQPGTVVLYRPRDGTRTFRVCWMSRGEPGVVDGIDLFDIDRLRLVDVVVPRQRRTAANTMPCTYNP
jgi:hypothetical protein